MSNINTYVATVTREATIKELVEGIVETYGTMSGQLINAELAHYFSAPQLNRTGPDDVEADGFFYVSIETWQRWDAEVKQYFKHATWSGLGKHPSIK